MPQNIFHTKKLAMITKKVHRTCLVFKNTVILYQVTMQEIIL